MDNEKRVRVKPAIAPHPSEVVSDYLDFLGWTRRELARRTGLAPKTVGEICNGKAAVKPVAALRLERVLQRPAHLWLNLQRQFDETAARQEAQSESK